MGIINIHILRQDETSRMIRQAQAALEEKLIGEHRRGEHTWGYKRRECPLCQAGK